MNNPIKRSLLNALGTVVYIAIIATVLQNAERMFGGMNKILQPMVFLTLLVVSAAITGGLVLGKPALMYIDGKKPEAIKLFLCTIGWLVLALIILILVSH